MCAIAGVIGRADAGAEVLRMLKVQRHRGPDGGGVFLDPAAGFALGHRRLAILVLSDAGAQPLTSRDGRWTIAFNGEIFNHREIAEELGFTPRTRTDTEVLLEACAKWGVERALGRSIGMFGFALWDARERVLTLGRDRVGEKPLVYFWDGRVLAFASEIKALAPLTENRLDAEAVDAFLALGYVPAPLAVFRRCRKLPPGHLLTLRDGAIQVRRWWYPERAASERREPSETTARDLLASAVGLRLRADVPLALYLSGGVDSSVIAAECVRQGAALEAFTVAFDGDRTDLPYARRVARQLGLRHHVVEAAPDLALDEGGWLRHYDEPFADSSALPSVALARALEGRYKAVLNGDGGDEAFGGYRHYEFIRAKQALKAMAAVAGMTDGRGSGALGVYVQSKASFREGARARLLNGNTPRTGFGERLAEDEFLQAAPAGALKRALWSDRHLYLPNDLTYKMDIALAAHGIEGRAPFLDHRVLEWTQTLKPRELVSGSRKKVLLREAYRGQLPDEVLDRPKHGFGAPVAQWLAGPLREIAEEALPCPLLDPGAQRNARGQKLWALVVFACWARRWRATW